MDKDKEKQGVSISAYLIPEVVKTKPKVTSNVEDTPAPDGTPDRATKTLPEGLGIRASGIPAAGLGVWAERDLEEGTRFGPYEGVEVDKIAGYKSGYAWEIRSDGGQGELIHCVDAEDETKSNWMRYVNCACKESEQNLRSYQDGEDIFYIAYKPIKAGTELLTFYGEEYGRKLGVETEPSTVATGDTHLCNICGQLLTSVEFLTRHLKYVHQSRYGIPSTYNMNADVSDYMKSVKQGKDLLEKAVSQTDTSPKTSAKKAAIRKSRLGSAIQRAIKSTRPSKAPSTPKKGSEDLVLLDNEDDDIRLTGSTSKHSWSLKADSDDELADTAVPDLDEGKDVDEMKASRDKLSPEQDESELDWHLCHECGQLFDEEEYLEIHVAARHNNGGKDVADKKTTPSTEATTDGKASSKSEDPMTKKISNAEGKKMTVLLGIKKSVKPATGGTAKEHSSDVGARSDNIFDKFGPILGKRTTSKAEERSVIAKADVVEITRVENADDDKAKDGPVQVDRERTQGSVDKDLPVHSSRDEVESSDKIMDKADQITINGHDHPTTNAGLLAMGDETSGQLADVNEVGTDQRDPISTVGDFIQVDDTAYADQAQVGSHYALDGDFIPAANVNIEKEIVEIIPGDEDQGESTVNSLASRKIEDGMSQQVWRQNICSICKKACHNRQALEEHQKTHTLFQCVTCFVSFINEDSLRQHEVDHKERPFFCGTCGKTYKSQSSLKEHEYSHTGHRPFVCPYCPKGFMRNKKLKVHIKRNHKKLIRAAQKPHPPPLVLPQNNQFENSTSVSDVDNYICKFCSFEFFDRDEFREHEANCVKAHATMTSSDQREGEFKCETCNRSYPSKKMLERHSKVHQIWGTASSISASSAASSLRDSDSIDDISVEAGTFPDEVRPPRPFKCQLCESTFLEESHLQIHVEIHSMDGPWACVVCKRKLKQRAHLLEHIYVHWGYKPYVCLYCPMDFKRAYEAERHMISHKQQQRETVKHGRIGATSKNGDVNNAGEVDESTGSILQVLLTKPQTRNESLVSTVHNPSDDFASDDFAGEDVGEAFKNLGDSSLAPQSVTPLRCPDDGKNRPFACELCDRAFTAKSSLREHLFLHFGKPYPCDFCERQFTRKAYLISHMKEVHPEADTSAIEDSVLDAKYEEIINKALERNQSMDQKKISQPDMIIEPISDRPYVCKVCGKSFEFSATLKKHMQAHVKLKPLLCDFCERRFVRQSYLDDHIKTQHPPGLRSKDPNKPFKCEICDLTFSKRSYLKDHRYRHKLKKPFPCSFCTKSFRRRCLLLMHTSRHHPNEHRQMVPNQPKAASASHSPGYAPNTLKIKLPFQKQKSAASLDSSLKRDPLMCHECGTTFSSVANVRRHLRIHSGERPFTCKFCSWSFNRKEVWKGHMKKKHAEELRAAKNRANPNLGRIKTEGFNCDKCGGTFKSSYALSVHLKQHSQGSSSRPFKCSLCDLAFIRQSDRTKHLKFVHGLDQADIDASALGKKEIKMEPNTTPLHSTPQTVTLPNELHVCHRCGARFDSFWGLESHSRVHEKHSRFPRPYKCVECWAAFKGLSNHTRHMRVHTPEYIAETKMLLNEMPGRKSRVQTSTTSPPNLTVEPTDKGPFLSGKEARRHVCPKCGTSYKYARNLKKHIPRHIKSSDRPFQCKVCGIYAKTKTSIAKHGQIHGPQAATSTSTSTVSYDCVKCGNAFTTKQELLKHLASHTQSISFKSMFRCKYCSAGFKHRGSLTIHERSHSKLNFGFMRGTGHAVNATEIFRNGDKQVFVIKGLQCPVCEKTFTRRSGVSNHKKVHPDVEFVWEEELMGSVDMTSDRPYQCRICLMRFMRRSGLSNHMHSHRIKVGKSNPSPSKTYTKTESDGFLLSTDNEGVTSNAEERPFSCEQCLCTFKTKGSLTTHTKVHSHDRQDERNHVCDICQCRFISSTNLKKHQKVHTGQPGTPVRTDPVTMYSQLENAESIDIKTKRPFRCRLCGDTFKAKHLLDDHIQVHSVSPRQSAVRQKEQSGLAAHLTESSGEALIRMSDRPFPCPICGDRFRLRTTKYKHIRLHKQSAGKPFKCVECGLGFYSVGNMTKHLRRAHRRFSNNVGDEPVAEMLNSLKVTPEPVSQSVRSPIRSPCRPSKMRPFACKYCGDTFTMRCNMNRHRKRHETGDNLPFRCSHCGFGFKSTKERTKHIMRVHNEDPKDNVTPDFRKPIRTGLKTYKCPICEDNFSDSSGIYKHLRVHAKSANKPYKCDVCKIGYNTMVGLSRHRGRVKHFGSAPGNEGLASSSKQLPPRDIKPDLISLQASLGKNMHKCHYCPATYKDRSSVWRHERVHKLGVSNTRPFSCKTCGFACYSKTHLERHVQMHRRAPGFIHPDLQSRKKSTSDRCKRCGLSFRTKSLYLVHMKRCSRTSTFVCKICSVPFSNQIMLTKHVRQDHGGLQRDVINLGGRRIIRETGHDKKFCCDQCDQRYKRPSELEKHLRRHALGFIRPQEGFTPSVIKQEEDVEVNVETMEESYEENLPLRDDAEQTNELSEVEVPSTSTSSWNMTAGRIPVHNRTNKSDRARPFVCQTCGFAFMTVIHLRKHTRLHKVAHTKPFVCKICTLGYTRLLDYHRHCNVVHPWGKGKGHQDGVRCPRCKEKFENKSDLVEHLEKQSCKFVDDLPEVETNLQGGDGTEEMNTASAAVEGVEGEESAATTAAATRQGFSNKHLVCPICSYQFLARPHLETHMKNHDNWENQPFRCERCQIGYSTKQHLSKHVNMNIQCIKLAREKERKKKLDEQNNTMTTSSTEFNAELGEMAQPQMSRSGKLKRHICQYCKKGFVKRGQLRFHLELHKPSPDRPHVCAKCGMGYKTLSNYAKHMKWEHSRPTTSQEKLTAAIFMCRDCGYSVTKKSLLEEHTRFGCPKKKENPATEAPQACPVCGNYFNSAGMLCIHIHEHIYHKLFICSQCPLRFANPEEREKHELNHPDWNNMLLQLLSSEFNHRLNHPEDGQTIRVKTEPGLEEDAIAPYVAEKVLQQGPSTGVLVVKPEPVDEPEYNYDLGSLQDSALGDYQALLPDTSDSVLPSIFQQTRRPEGQSSSASRLEKIVSNLAAQKPSSTDWSKTSPGIFSGSSLSSQRRPSVEKRPSTSTVVSTPVSSVSTSVSTVSTSASGVNAMPDSETLAKQVAEVLPSSSPAASVKPSPNVVSKKSMEQKATPKQKLFRCRYCPSAFRLKGLCMAHERQSHRKIYSKASDNSKRPLKDISKMSVCDICNAVFEQQSSLSRHMLFKHGVPLKPKEPAGDDTIQRAHGRAGRAEVHYIADDGNVSEGPFITNITSQGNLHNEAVQHEQPSLLQQRLEAPLSPSLVRPSSSGQPMSHLESLLTGRSSSPVNQSSLLSAGELDYRPYKCDKCNFAFTQRHHLVRHIKRDSCAFHVLGRKAAAQLKGGDVGSKPTSTNVHGMKIKVAEKKHKCKKCSKAFWKRIRLENHMRVHHGEGLFQCQFCAKEFRLRVDCADHEDSCPFGPGAMDDLDLNGGDLGYEQGVDFGQTEDQDFGPDAELEPDVELERAQEQAFVEDQNDNLGYENSNHLSDSLVDGIEDDREWMGIQIKQEPLD
ncbi:uncharacterized protein LOC764375 isoform X2 [Strongylocentrotus purpuratus]|uniref:Uncharacterized protein n=1 Tax=Strongylocentrotus purpuratus TaxID=7668 RepID=A0A7M7NAS4_STRPU|nr:uncharacterized protein LOC764375 isoform X2 [Strongylocentrotus purpuratus]